MKWLILISTALLSSSQSFALDSETQSILDAMNAMDKANSAIKKASSFDRTCISCQVDGIQNEVNFETREQCGKERNYLEPSLKKLRALDPNGYYWKPRTYVSGKNTVPPKCVLYTMRTVLRDTPRTASQKQKEEWQSYLDQGKDTTELKDKIYTDDAKSFAYCKNDSGTPERIGGKPCVTENYFHTIYNTFSDVADCMDLPMNFATPKFANESGFQLNAFGPVNDGGIGQFTSSALADVAQNYDKFKSQIETSEKDSCQRLRSIPGSLVSSSEEILTEDAERCHVIGMPPNPVRSLIYYGIFYKSTQRNIENAWNREGKVDAKKVDDLLKEARIGKFDKEKIKEMLFVGAYNMGTGTTVRLFREWLNYRIKSGEQITAKDFNFDFWPPKGFGAIEKEIKAKKNAQALENGWDEERLKAEIAREKMRRRLIHIGAVGREINFPEYLYTFYGGNFYISQVKYQATNLNKVFEEGTCAQNKFLAL